MSTKTAFKRIALVAAAALAIGGISAVSAQAVGGPDWVITNAVASNGTTSAETATQVAGTYNFVTLTTTAQASAGGVAYAVTGGSVVGGATSGSFAGAGTINIATPTAGTVTVTSYDIAAGAASATATSTVTITVIAALPGTVYASSTVLGNSVVAAPTPTTDAAYSVTAPANGAQVAEYSVAELDAAGNPILAANAKGITVTSTNGLVSSPDLLVAPVANTTYISGTPANAVSHFILSSITGLPGASTVTISVNGVVVKTYTATFTGAAAKIVLTAINTVVAVGSATAELTAGVTANTNALKIQEFDAAGNAIAVSTGTITVTPAAAAIATAGSPSVAVGVLPVNFLGGMTSGTALSSTVAGVSLAGVSAGTTTFTATDSTGTLTSLPVTVRVSSGVPTKVVLTTDKTAYPAGGVGTLTTTLSDAAGTLPAGAYTVFTGPVSSTLFLAAGMGSLPGASVAVNNDGMYTDAFNAPLSDGTVTISGTPAAATIVVTPAVFTVTSSASDAANAAVDAANEATDAANAATDAANAAADSADAATQAAQDAGDKADAALAAVTALSQQVVMVLAKVAALSKLLVRIIKKTHA